MSSKRSVAHPAHHPEYTVDDATRSRVLRGLSLFKDNGRFIEPLGHGRYSVPSCSGEGAYEVDLDVFGAGHNGGGCTCRDRVWPCKHGYAARIWRAKSHAKTRREEERRRGPRRSPADVAASLERMGA